MTIEEIVARCEARRATMTIEEIVVRCEALRRAILDVVPALPIDEWCDRYEDPHLKGYSLIGKWKPADDPRVLTKKLVEEELPETMNDPAVWASVFKSVEMVLEMNLWKPLSTPMCTTQYHPDTESRQVIWREAAPLQRLMEELSECQSALTEELPGLLFAAWLSARPKR